jgi:hypothetical protein
LLLEVEVVVIIKMRVEVEALVDFFKVMLV